MDDKETQLLMIETAHYKQHPEDIIKAGMLKIKTKTDGLKWLELNNAQKIFLACIEKIRRDNVPVRILLLKARQAGLCGSPEMRVLTSDLRWISLRDIKEGQEIICTDEFPRVQDGKRRRLDRKMRTGIVLGKESIFEIAYRLKMDDGRELVLTPEHRMLSKKGSPDGCDRSETCWREAKDFEIGNQIRYITDVWGESNFDDGWFGGMIDGEGSFRFSKGHTGSEITVCQIPGKVFDSLVDYGKKNGYTFGIARDGRRTTRFKEKDYKRNRPTDRIEFSRMNELFKLLGKTRPKKHIGKKWWEGKSLPGKNSGMGWSKVIGIEKLQKQEMIDLQTSEKTFIMEGFVSHNSTLTEAVIFCNTISRDGINSLVIADDVKGSNYIFEMQKLFYEYLGDHLKPAVKHSNEKKLEFEGIHSQVMIDTAENKDVGRKMTLQYVHLSECSRFPDLKEVMLGLNQSVPSKPGTIIILETTANGMEEFYDMWQKAKKGVSEWRAVFIPWFELPEYRLPLEGGEFYPIDGISGDRVKFLKDEKKLKERFGLDDEQLNWRRWCIVNNCGGDLDLWAQEYPSDDVEAFLMSGSCFFDKDGLLSQEDKRKKWLGSRNKVVMGDIVKLEGRYIFRESIDGRYRRYETPDKDSTYVVGADAAEGLAHGDDAAMVVLNKKYNRVAMAMNCTADTDELAEDVVKAANYYNMAMAAPENKGYGSAVCKKVYKAYGNIYRRIRDKSGVDDVLDEIGWNTNVSSRAMMLAQLKEEIRESAIDVLDEEILSQMGTFINDPKRKKAMADTGKKDDLIFALAIAIMVRTQYPHISRSAIEQARKNRFAGKPVLQNQGYGFKEG